MNCRKTIPVLSITGLAMLALVGCGDAVQRNNVPSSKNLVNVSSNKIVSTTSTPTSSVVGINSTDSTLPSSFLTYQDVWNSMGPYLAQHTSAQVLLPTLQGISDFSLHPWMNVQYKVSNSSYTIAVSVGGKLPPNSPKIIGGNANILYIINALNTNEPVPQDINWDNTSAVIPHVKTQSVTLGHGITGTMYTGMLDGMERRDIVWQEDGWTFGWESETNESVETTIRNAEAMIASNDSISKLPIKSGKFLSGQGSGGPSQVEFVVGDTRYILYAPGGRALQIMATMARVKN